MQKTYFQQLIYNFIKKPGLSTKTNFFRLMAVAQESGLGMRESMKSIMGAETNPEMKRIIHELLADINEGSSLGDAIAVHSYFFSTNTIELIRAAEKMGNLPDVLKDIAVELEKNQKIFAKLKKAIMYPVGLLGFTVVAVAILLVFVIPTIVELYGDPSELPSITQFMIKASDFLQKSRWMLLVGVVGSIITFQLLYKNLLMFKKTVDSLLLKTPVIGDAIKTFYMFNFSKLFGDFGKAGVSPVDAFDQMTKIFANYFYKRKMMSMKSDLEGGFSISESVEGSSLFDPILIQIMMVGEKTGSMADILSTMSSFYRFQLERKIDGLMGAIEPLMMGFIAMVIGTVVASIFLPMGGLLEQVG